MFANRSKNKSGTINVHVKIHQAERISSLKIGVFENNENILTMIHRLTEKERQQQYEQQLRDNANRVVEAFLSEPQYEAVRREYAQNFDEIKAAIDNPRNTLRTCVEDIGRLSPVINQEIMNDSLFFQELHRAIKEGYLTEDMLSSL